jgi:hypothetical protein
VQFKGHVVGLDGVEVMADKVEKVLNFKTPDSKEKVRSFLGLTGYYRRFVKDYAKITEPLTRLLRKGECHSRCRKNKPKPRRYTTTGVGPSACSQSP